MRSGVSEVAPKVLERRRQQNRDSPVQLQAMDGFQNTNLHLGLNRLTFAFNHF